MKGVKKHGRGNPSGRVKRWLKRAGAATLAFALAGTLGWAETQPAHAATVHELEGNWQPGTPDVLSMGDNVVSVWRFNINDDSAAPSNDPVDNVTVTFNAHGGLFTSIPGQCLTEPADPEVPLDPVSEIVNDGETLICNLGTRDQGTSELMLSGMEVSAETGEVSFVEAEIGGVQAALPPLEVSNPFMMDMKFNGGSRNTRAGSYQEVFFPWSLRHAPGGEPGPDTVQYTLTFSNEAGGTPLPFSNGDECIPIDRSFAGHPYSEASRPADWTAPFPGECTLTRIGSTNQYTLTVSGIDYTKLQVPTLDSAGNALETQWDVVAAGELRMYFTYDDPGRVSFEASAPTYTGATTGATSQDNPDNNSNAAAVTRGVWNGGWHLDSVGLPGSQWVDTSRASTGDIVRSAASVRPPESSTDNRTVACNVLDTRYTEFVQVQTGYISGGDVVPYEGSEDIRHWYYVGNGTANNLNPTHANYNPNDFTCDTGWGGADWTSTPPADLSQVKAVRIDIPYSAAAGVNAQDVAGVTRSYIDSRIKDDVAVGQDVWTWMSYNVTGLGSTGWFNPHRTMDPSDVPASGVLTPDARYPYTGGGRDVLRIITATPVVTKEVDQATTIPGANVQYTVTYRADSPSATTVPNYVITDVLPTGMEYVEGSASIQPTSVSGNTITWELADVETNTDFVLTYSTRVHEDAEPGDVFTNGVTAQIGGQSASATDNVRIRDGGYMQLTKTADTQKVPHNGGVATNSWTVRLTSHDTQGTAFTDSIDVLPYNGDGRGTQFSGSYQLSEAVQAPAGATVYYTTADPDTLVEDPDDASNGARGDVTGNTVGWSTTFTAEATGVRVITSALPAGQQQEFSISVVTEGASHEDRYVNRAESRSARHQLVMRTSSPFEIGAVNSVALRKYVQGSDGEWNDANDIDDYPAVYMGTTIPYRLVVTNTGDQTLTDLAITDDMIDLASLDPLPEGLATGGVIPELLPGEENAVTIEYEVPLMDRPAGEYLVNTACVVPTEDSVPEPGDGYDAPEVDPSCDPAGIIVLPSTLTWEKIAAGTDERLTGSEWELTPVDADGNPAGDPIPVIDCVADNAVDCNSSDVNPEPGVFTINPLDEGRYMLVETRAPAGYQLDTTSHFIDVLGVTSFEQPIENVQSDVPEIPLTGGVGALSFGIGAGILGLFASAGLLWQQRRKMGT